MSQAVLTNQIDWASIARGTPFKPGAFGFMQAGLSYTASIFTDREFDSIGLDDLDRHVTGQQLCMGLRDYAIERYGMLAQVVLCQWGIRRTEDFGSIVFRMVEVGLLRTSPQDSEEDFRAIYHFDEAFHERELESCMGSNR
jgi:uncharacterized repeat protein (TIGR04138 family)